MFVGACDRHSLLMAVEKKSKIAALSLRLNIFYCLFHTYMYSNGVGPQVLSTLVTALPL